jgi:hypothetical protein
MKVISYSLFGDPSTIEFNYYLRGVYWNARMNQLMLPEFETLLFVTKPLTDKYWNVFNGLRELFPKLHYVRPSIKDDPPRCEAMLYRMMPLWKVNGLNETELVLCRDACCINEWLDYKYGYHAINDNDAHGGLMGGLTGFRTKDFKELGYADFNSMIKGLDLSKHGSDQHFMNQKLLPKIHLKLLLHKLRGAGCSAFTTLTGISPHKKVDSKFKHADLVSRYIGTAGVIEMELIRWFQGVDKNKKYDDFERKHSDIMYWRR